MTTYTRAVANFLASSEQVGAMVRIIYYLSISLTCVARRVSHLIQTSPLNAMAANNTMIDPLLKTIESLKEIRSALLPYVRLLNAGGRKRKRHDDKIIDEDACTTKLPPHQRAEAEAAVALAMGTLRYMGARLRGSDVGRKKGDPLRIELDKIRGLMVSLRELEKKSVSSTVDDGVAKATADDNDNEIKDGGSKKKPRLI